MKYLKVVLILEIFENEIFFFPLHMVGFEAKNEHIKMLPVLYVKFIVSY